MAQLSEDTAAQQTDTELLTDPRHAAAIDKWDVIIALIVGCVTMFVYGRTLTPGLLSGDGGELQTLVYLLGNTHPTGYPVYLALARVFTLLPLGDLAYRVNLFSAFMGALTISGVYLCGRLLSGYRAVAAVGALALAISTAFWSQSVIAEVYTAGSAFIVFILLALLLWDNSGSNWALFGAGLLGGLSIGVHMSVVLLAPAVLLFLLLHWHRGWPMWRTAVLGALSGLAITLLLFLFIEWNNPTASYFNSVIEPSRSAWGYEADEIDGPLEHLWFGWQGRQFQYLMFSNMAEVMPQQAADYWAGLAYENAMPLIILAGLGALWLLLRRLRVAILLLTALIIQLFFFFNYEIWDLYVFYIPSYVLLAFLAISGMGALIELAGWILGKLLNGDRQTESKVVLDILIAVLVLAFVVWPILQPRQEALAAGEVPFEFGEYPHYDQNLKLLAAATVAGLPENAIVFTDWDMMWPYYYTAYLENKRTDLTFIESYPADDQEELATSLVRFVSDNLGKRPLFFVERPYQLEELGNVSISPKRVGPTRLFSLSEVQQ